MSPRRAAAAAAALVGGTDVEFVADSGATITGLIEREINTRSGATPESCPSLNMVT